MHARMVVSLTGAFVVTAYAAFLALHALVLDPLAAVPGQTLAQIHARVDAIGMSSRRTSWASWSRRGSASCWRSASR